MVLINRNTATNDNSTTAIAFLLKQKYALLIGVMVLMVIGLTLNTPQDIYTQTTSTLLTTTDITTSSSSSSSSSTSTKTDDQVSSPLGKQQQQEGGEGEEVPTTGTSSSSSSSSSSFHAEVNSMEVKRRRKVVADQCSEATTKEEVESIMTYMKNDMFVQASASSIEEQPRDWESSVKACEHVVMDFGANVGDTSGHAIDAGLFGCDRQKDLGIDIPHLHFNIESKEIEQVRGRNHLTAFLVKIMQDLSKANNKTTDAFGPEDYCYYGIEGNPVFTKRLQALEDYVMALRPRPLQHLHFFTESVGAGEDGPTKLWLDTVNEKQNFWGSSIFKDHQDVRKSASSANQTEAIAADVMGWTISTLMKKTLLTFHDEHNHHGGHGQQQQHLLLKVDIEGGEYPLLIEAAESGVLCDFVNRGHKADLFIEFHSQRVTGSNPLVHKVKDARAKLEACGIQFRNLQAWWA